MVKGSGDGIFTIIVNGQMFYFSSVIDDIILPTMAQSQSLVMMPYLKKDDEWLPT